MRPASRRYITSSVALAGCKAYTFSVPPSNTVRKLASLQQSRCILAAQVTFDDRDKRIDFYHHPHGYKTEPFQWEELRTIVATEQLGLLSRSIEQQKEYEIYKRELKKSWKSLLDHVLCSKFDFEAKLDESSGLLHARLPLDQTSVVKKYLVPNNFPYYVADGISHSVLWKLHANCSQDDVEDALQQIRDGCDNRKVEFLYWINPPHLKSLPEIDHVHILSRVL